MAYRPNFGGGYEPSYNSPNNLGFSNVSRNYNKASFRSRVYSMQITTLRTTEDWEKSSLCSKTKGISSDRPKKNSSLILTTSARGGLSSRTNS
jgi:hypothetical protein